MTETRQSVDAMPGAHPAGYAVGDVTDGRRWNGVTWEFAGAEGVASVRAPGQHEEEPSQS